MEDDYEQFDPQINQLNQLNMNDNSIDNNIDELDENDDTKIQKDLIYGNINLFNFELSEDILKMY